MRVPILFEEARGIVHAGYSGWRSKGSVAGVAQDCPACGRNYRVPAQDLTEKDVCIQYIG